MGLAPYGEPKYAGLIRDKLVELKPDGSFRLDLAYFDYCTGLRMTNSKFDDLMGGPPRKADEWLTQRHMDIAASLQVVTEEIVARLVDNALASFGMRTLCLAGGGAIELCGKWKGMAFGEGRPAVDPAGGRRCWRGCGSGTRSLPSLTACRGGIQPRRDGGPPACRWCAVRDNERRPLPRDNRRCPYRPESDRLVSGTDGIWPEGARVPLHPRRSARSRHAEGLTLKIKYRESFRPFAPAVLYEDAANWFDLDKASPYMLFRTMPSARPSWDIRCPSATSAPSTRQPVRSRNLLRRL
jgi:carbamoyltransferase